MHRDYAQAAGFKSSAWKRQHARRECEPGCEQQHQMGAREHVRQHGGSIAPTICAPPTRSARSECFALDTERNQVEGIVATRFSGETHGTRFA